MDGWRAAEHPGTWQVEDGCLVARGRRSHLFYQGVAGDHDFRNFELVAEVRTGPSVGQRAEWNRTGSLSGVRNIYRSNVSDGEWFELRISVVVPRIRIWVDRHLAVDYVEPPYKNSLSA